MAKDIRYFLNLFRHHYPRMALGTALGWTAIIASVGLLALSGWFISATALAGLSLATAHLFNFFYPGIGVRLFAFTRTISRYAERIIVHDTTFRMLASLRVWFYQKIEPLVPARLMQFRSADILNRILADIDTLDNLYARVLSPSIAAIFTILAVALFLLIFDVWIAVVALIFLLLCGIALPITAGKLGARIGRNLAQHTALMRIYLVESVQGLSEMILFDAWNTRYEHLKTVDHELIRLQAHMSMIRGLSTGVAILFTGIGMLICLYMGVGRVENQVLNGTNLAVIAFAVLASFESLAPLSQAYQYLGQTKEAGKRLREVVDEKPSVVFPNQSHHDISTYEIIFKDLDFKYSPSDDDILRNVDLCIESNQRVAILGETGAGKSTLLNLLVRFWNPTHGNIYIGGHDIQTFTEPALRSMMGVVPQQTHIFHASIRQNLLMARADARDDLLISVLEKAQLGEWLRSLPDGLDTWIGEGGGTISGGQARRLCLARLFLQNAPIWILDEPTEGLDRFNQQKIMHELLSSNPPKTLLVITHLNTDLDKFDRIIMLHKGGIIAQGSHTELLASCDQYRSLVEV